MCTNQNHLNKQKKVNIMKEIISFPFFSANNPDKNVTFYEACEAGNVETVKSLLQSRDREWQDDPESQSL